MTQGFIICGMKVLIEAMFLGKKFWFEFNLIASKRL